MEGLLHFRMAGTSYALSTGFLCSERLKLCSERSMEDIKTLSHTVLCDRQFPLIESVYGWGPPAHPSSPCKRICAFHVSTSSSILHVDLLAFRVSVRSSVPVPDLFFTLHLIFHSSFCPRLLWYFSVCMFWHKQMISTGPSTLSQQSAFHFV